MQNTQEYRETSCHACLTRSCDVRPRDVSGAVIWTSKFRRSYQHISNPLPSVCRLRRTQPDLITPEYDHLLQMSHTDTWCGHGHRLTYYMNRHSPVLNFFFKLFFQNVICVRSHASISYS